MPVVFVFAMQELSHAELQQVEMAPHTALTQGPHCDELHFARLSGGPTTHGSLQPAPVPVDVASVVVTEVVAAFVELVELCVLVATPAVEVALVVDALPPDPPLPPMPRCVPLAQPPERTSANATPATIERASLPRIKIPRSNGSYARVLNGIEHVGARRGSSIPKVKDPRTTPTGVKAPHGARVMSMTWADGHASVFPHDVLRAYCPCAHCQGHGGTIKRVEPPPDAGEAYLDIREIERVGNYALSFTWGDQHSTGIYTFKYLRSLCQCDECRPSFHLGEESHGEA
jgi:DUF971 family protein